jgi:hypothetical protein
MDPQSPLTDQYYPDTPLDVSGDLPTPSLYPSFLSPARVMVPHEARIEPLGDEVSMSGIPDPDGMEALRGQFSQLHTLHTVSGFVEPEPSLSRRPISATFSRRSSQYHTFTRQTPPPTHLSETASRFELIGSDVDSNGGRGVSDLSSVDMCGTAKPMSVYEEYGRDMDTVCDELCGTSMGD